MNVLMIKEKYASALVLVPALPSCTCSLGDWTKWIKKAGNKYTALKQKFMLLESTEIYFKFILQYCGIKLIQWVYIIIKESTVNLLQLFTFFVQDCAVLYRVSLLKGSSWVLWILWIVKAIVLRFIKESRAKPPCLS